MHEGVLARVWKRITKNPPNGKTIFRAENFELQNLEKIVTLAL